MDPTRFDRLTKSLGTARSRRGVLTALGGALAGALALRREVQAATPGACRQTWIACRAQAIDTLDAAADVCEDTYHAAVQACPDTYDAAVQACFANPDPRELEDCLERAQAARHACLDTPFTERQACLDRAEAALQQALGQCDAAYEQCTAGAARSPRAPGHRTTGSAPPA